MAGSFDVVRGKYDYYSSGYDVRRIVGDSAKPRHMSLSRHGRGARSMVDDCGVC